MDVHSVNPDIIDTNPPHVVEIKYSNGSEVNLGNELTPTQVKDVPNYIAWPIEENALYTLIMTDPDAPSRLTPSFREINHWLVVNIPGTDIGQGKTIREYIGSGAPKGTGLHRYVFLVYKQPRKFDTDEKITSNRSRDGRLKFSTKDFVNKYNLGPLVAGNLFQAQYDDYVPILHEQLSNN